MVLLIRGNIQSSIDRIDYLPDGNSAQPGLGFASDHDTGFYHPADNTVGLSTGATTRLEINDTSMTANVDLVPAGNGTYDLGSVDNRWNDVYMGNVLYIGNTSIEESNGNITVSNIEAASFVGDGSGLSNLDAGNVTTGTIDVARLPDASTSAQGVVQLTSATDSTSETLAATASAVKTLADGKVSKSGDTMTGGLTATSFSGDGSALTSLNASNLSTGTVGVARLPDASTSAQGVVQLSSATNSTSTTLAATASAVKSLADGKVSKSGDTMTGSLVGVTQLGVGTTNPSTILELSKAVSSVGNEDLMIHFNNTYQTYFDWRLGATLTSGPNAVFQLKGGANGTSLTPFLTVSGIGYVGINTTSPAYTLDVAGDARVTDTAANFIVHGTNNSIASRVAGIIVKSFQYRESGFYIQDENGTERWLIGGKYGTRDTDGKNLNFTWNGSSTRVTITGYDTNAMYVNGGLYVAGAVSVASLTNRSDDRLKYNESFIDNATATLMKLRPQTYVKTSSIDADPSDDDPLESGLIAQEVWYDAPELRHLVKVPDDAEPAESIQSSTDPTQDPDYSSWGSSAAALNYTGLIPYLIKSNQEQQARIDALTTELAEIRQMLSSSS